MCLALGSSLKTKTCERSSNTNTRLLQFEKKLSLKGVAVSQCKRAKMQATA